MMRFLRADRTDKPKHDLTLMVIPHNEDRIRELHVSPILIRLCIGLLVLHLCAVGIYGARYMLLKYRTAQSETLEAENQDLKSQLAGFQERLKLLSSRVDLLAASDTRFRAWTGLPEPGVDVRQLGVGGGAASLPAFVGIGPGTRELLEEAYVSLDRLTRAAQFLGTSFDSISARMEESEIGRRNTPTILPLPPAAAYWRSEGYGYRSDPFTGRREFHNGIDLAGHEGTPILATADGEVHRVGRDKRLGYYIALLHGFGRRTLYGHLRSRPTLKVGQTVKRGDVIGEMGNTGRSTGPHLHYSVFKNGRSEDPGKYIID
jgi:murein DD-endopeptidase MepM/ murein hydrolase activator NlpD